MSEMSWKNRLPVLFREIINHDNSHKDMLTQSTVNFLDYKSSKRRKQELLQAAEKYIKDSRNPKGVS